jgi:drug/metabolite transporter (DMT)-like permease
MLSLAAARRPWRRVLPFVPVGLCFGLSYVCIFEAYYRGRVSVVSPLVATESLWGVGLSAILIGRSERISGRVVAGALLIVGGAALIGAVR